jgi:hypothetical protein
MNRAGQSVVSLGDDETLGVPDRINYQGNGQGGHRDGGDKGKKKLQLKAFLQKGVHSMDACARLSSA